MVVVKPELQRNYSPLSLTLTMINGSGSNHTEYDNRKNFTARLLYDDTYFRGKFRLLVGGSTYQGGMYQGGKDLYFMEGNRFTHSEDLANIGQYGDRTYYCGEVTMQLKTLIGTTALNAEF